MNGYEGAAAGAASVLARLAAGFILRQHMGKATLDKRKYGCEFWRNRQETIWFVKCMSCPEVGGFLPSRAAADSFAVHHLAEVHDISRQH